MGMKQIYPLAHNLAKYQLCLISVRLNSIFPVINSLINFKMSNFCPKHLKNETELAISQSVFYINELR